MSRTPVFTTDAPPPRVGIYSQAIVCNGLVYCSGSLPADPEMGQLIEGDITAHTVCYTFQLYTGERVDKFDRRRNVASGTTPNTDGTAASMHPKLVSHSDCCGIKHQ